MKKKLLMFGIIIVVLFGALFIINKQDSNNVYGKPSAQLNSATKKLLNDPNYQNIILPGPLDELAASTEGGIVYFFASDCQYCKETTPLLMPIADELGANIEQFNLREYTDYFNKYGIQYTPTLVYFEGGKEVDRLVGGISTQAGNTEDDFRAFIEKYSQQ